MEVKNVKIQDIKPYENNPRDNDAGVDAVANSIDEFGWQQPIVVDKDNVIIVGHTRYLAAKKLGLKEVPVKVATGLTPEQVKAYRLADNKTGELTDWDIDLLDDELNDIFDIDMADFGFDFEKDEDEDLPVEPQYPVSNHLGLENNYIVLKFESDIDWLQAQTFFNLEKVRWNKHSKKPHIGVGRVIDGANVIKQLLEQGATLNEKSNDDD